MNDWLDNLNWILVLIYSAAITEKYSDKEIKRRWLIEIEEAYNKMIKSTGGVFDQRVLINIKRLYNITKEMYIPSYLDNWWRLISNEIRGIIG